MKTEIWYSVQNCGDGSAYPQWMESEELAKIDQNFMEEGWGEDCIGSLVIEHESPIKILDSIMTVDEAIKNTKEEMEYNLGSTIKSKLEALKKLKEKQNESSLC